MKIIRMIRLFFALLFLAGIGALGFVVAAHAPLDKTTRYGPGGSKFVSSAPPEREIWRMPTLSEALVYYDYFLGAPGSGTNLQAKGPGEVHADLVNAVQQSLEMAEQMGVHPGPTLFDADLGRTAPEPRRLPQIPPPPAFAPQY